MADRGPEGDHVPVGVFSAEDTAFESGVYGLDFRYFIVFSVIDFLHGFKDGGVHVGFPPGVGAAEFDLGTGQGEEGPHAGAQDILGRVDGAAHQAGDADHLFLLVRFDDSHIGGGLHESGHGVAHADYAVGGGQDGPGESRLGILVDDCFGAVDRFNGDGEVGFGDRQFFFHDAGDLIDQGHEIGDFLVLDHHQSERFAGDGIAEASAVDGGEADAELASRFTENTEEDFVGISAAQGDVNARVAFISFTWWGSQSSLSIRRLTKTQYLTL